MTRSSKIPVPRKQPVPIKDGVDFVGDVHGHSGRLQALLRKMGYRKKAGCYRHQGNHTVFLGDILNRGPDVVGVAEIVQRMVGEGTATLLPGNHEFLALWDAAHRSAGLPSPLQGKTKQHLERTKKMFTASGKSWNRFLDFLWTCPLVFDAGAVRGVHACWDATALSLLPDNRLRKRDFLPGSQRRFQAVWRLVEGPSVVEPTNGIAMRVRWWASHSPTWRQYAYPEKPALSDHPLPALRLSQSCGYPDSAPPLFFGHYGFPKAAAPLRPNLACLDLGVGSGGSIAGYRWNGESRLLRRNFVVA